MPAKRQQCEAGGDAVSSCPPVDPADATPPPLQKYSSNKQRKKALWKVVQVRRASLAHIMEPILHIFAAKALDMDKAAEKAKKYMEWLTMPDHMREGKGSMAEYLRDEDEGEELLVDMTDAYWKRRAFETHDDPGAMQRAADYADEWFAEGKRRFCTDYICRVESDQEVFDAV